MAAAAADQQPALALTRFGQPVRLGEVLSRSDRQGNPAAVRARLLGDESGGSRPPAPPVAAGSRPRRLSQPVPADFARLARERVPGPGGTAPRLAGRRPDPRHHRAVRRGLGRSRPVAAGRQPVARRGGRSAPVGPAFRGLSTSKCSATTRRKARAAPGKARGWRRGSGLPLVATHPIQFIAVDDFRAHEARVCIADGEMLANPRRVRRFTPDAVFQDPRGNDRSVRGPARSPGQQRRDRAALLVLDEAGRVPPAGVPDTRRHGGGRLPSPAVGARAWSRGWQKLFPDPVVREASPQEEYDSPAADRVRHDHRHGLSRLLPDRGGLHRLGQGQRRAGRTRPRVGRGLAGGVRTRHHRPRPDAVRACCSSASSTRSGCRCRTSTSISARTAASGSSSTCARSTAAMRCRRSRPSAPWRARR